MSGADQDSESKKILTPNEDEKREMVTFAAESMTYFEHIEYGSFIDDDLKDSNHQGEEK